MEPSKLKIAIIGAGPGGLCTAIALHRGGFKNITVYERDQNSDARKQGYSFTLFAPVGGLGFLKRCGLFERVEPYMCRCIMRIIDGNTSRLLIEMTRALGRNFQVTDSRRVMRGGLRKVLVDVCQKEGIIVKWNAKYTSYEEKEKSVILKFENEPDNEVDLLIAADGIHSKVRDQMIGDPALYTGYTSMCGLLDSKDNAELIQHPFIHHSGAMFGGSGKTFFLMHHHAENTNEVFWSLSQFIPEGEIRKQCGEDPAKLKQMALEKLKEWDLPLKIVSSTPESGVESTIIEYKDKTPLNVNPTTGRVCNSKTKRITLLGDAAHPMLPFQAAGCNNALLDVEKLTGELGKLISLKQITTEDIDKALGVYEQEMVVRTSAACFGARKSAWDHHNPNKLFRLKRNMMLKAWHWKVTVYEESKAVQWTFKVLVAGFAFLLLAIVYSYFTR